MEKDIDNRMESERKKGKKAMGDHQAHQAYKKPATPKAFTWEGKSQVTLPHVGVVIPGATFTVQPHQERLMAFCINNDKFTEVI